MKKSRKVGDWICGDCGSSHGRHWTITSTWHVGTCDYCNSIRPVTSARDYGYPALNSEPKKNPED